MNTSLRLVSHPLCPYVQRAAIVLHEKGVAFERVDVDLAHKPDWFLKLSPLGKTPLLRVGDSTLFESAVICEYLDETLPPRMHPADALARAQHRAWVEFSSALLNGIAAFYNAADSTSLDLRAADLRRRLQQLETTLDDGPFFAGPAFSLVDAAFGPVFRYFDVFEALGVWVPDVGLQRVNAWRQALAQRPSVQQAASSDYAARLKDFLLRRGAELSARVAAVGP